MLVVVVKYLVVRHARRQPRRRRHPRAARARRSRRRATQQRTRGIVVLDPARPVRRALLYGDGVITPAISVLSARRGLEVATHRASSRSSCRSPSAILIGLFLVQQRGTGAHRRGLRPGDAASGSSRIARARRAVRSSRTPRCSRAVEPALRGRASSSHHGLHGFLVLGAVVLVHHRRRGALRGHGPLRHARRSASPGTRSCFPALLLNYFGQGALLLARGRRRVEQPVLRARRTAGRCYPDGRASRRSPRSIASQALISGAFSLTQQAVQLGYLPRVHDRAHVGRRGGADLHPRDQLGADGRVHRARARLPQLDRTLAAAYGIAVTARWRSRRSSSTRSRADAGAGAACSAGSRASRCSSSIDLAFFARER